MSEKLPPEIARLLEREANAYAEDATLKEVVRRRVESAVALGASGGTTGDGQGLATSPAANVAKGIAAPIVGMIAVGAFVAGNVVGFAARPSLAPAPAVAPSTVSPLPADTASSIPSSAPLDQAAPSPSAIASVHGASSSDTSAKDNASNATGDLIRERELLDVARAALAHGRPLDAIAAAKRHEKKWPKGDLVEEREVVWIQALVATGEDAEARTRATNFHRRFPRSALAGAVDSAIESSSSSGAMTDSGAP